MASSSAGVTRSGVKKYAQKYCKEWEYDPNLKDWICPDPTGENYARCKYCKVTLVPHKKELNYHAKSKKHIKAVSLDKAAKSCQQLPFVKTVSQNNKTAELKIAAYIAEHSAIQNVDHLGEILPCLDLKSEVLGTLKIHRTKCSMLIKNVLGPVMMQEMISDVGDAAYSLIVDETTDISTDKILCLMIRYFSKIKQEIITTFYRYIKISKCDATTIYETIKNTLLEDSLRLEMLVGIGLDGTNVMIGEHHSSTLIRLPRALAVRRAQSYSD